MKTIDEVYSNISEILMDIELDVIIDVQFNNRLKKVIANIKQDERMFGEDMFELNVSSLFFSLDEKIQLKILQHEIAHAYDIYKYNRNSKHDKTFKELCGKLYGEHNIGNATIKEWIK